MTRRITNEVLAEKLDNLSRELSEFKDSSQVEHMETKDLVREQNGRVRKNEAKIAWLLGGLAAIGFFFGAGLISLWRYIQ